MKIKVKQVKRGLTPLRKKLKNLKNATVEVGHFQEQCEHYSGKTYAELMYYHHRGGSTTGDQLVTKRPVLDILFAKNLNLTDKQFKRVFNNWKDRKPGAKSNKLLLDSLGKVLANKEKDIIGNANLLPVTNNPTPLRDTGDLRDNVAHRDSLNPKIRTV